MITQQDLLLGFKKMGLKKGDVLLVHSSFKSFAGVEGGPQAVISALLTVLGTEGTLIVPTFTFTFCQQFNDTGNGFFDLENTPSEMGIITELVRKMPGSKRTVNPIYSVSIHGKLANKLALINDKSAYGKNSIFGKLHDLKGKIMIIGLDFNHSMTFFHHVEEMHGIDYRYPKQFTGTIVANGKKYQDTFTMLVRDIAKGVETSVNPMGELLEKNGLVANQKIGESLVKLMDAVAVFDFTSQAMKQDPHLLYIKGS